MKPWTSIWRQHFALKSANPNKSPWAWIWWNIRQFNLHSKLHFYDKKWVRITRITPLADKTSELSKKFFLTCAYHVHDNISICYFSFSVTLNGKAEQAYRFMYNDKNTIFPFYEFLSVKSSFAHNLSFYCHCWPVLFYNEQCNSLQNQLYRLF